MKIMLTSLLLLGLATLVSAETIYKSDFAGKKVKPLSVWGKVDKGVLTANGRYDFAGMLLAPSKKDLKITCTFKTTGSASFGMILNGIVNGRATKRLSNIVWGAKAAKERTAEWTINAKYLKKHSYIYFYCINNKKGDLQIKDLKIESVSPAAAKLPGLVVYQSDFRKHPAPFMVWGGKRQNGTLISNGKYDFGGIILPESKQPYTVTCTLKCDPGTALGLILFKANGRRPGARLQSVSWNAVKNKEFRTYTWKLDAKYLKTKSFLIFYCINPKYGNLTIKDLRIERIAEKLEIPELKKKIKLNDRFTLQEAAGMLHLTDFMKFPNTIKAPAAEQTDVFLGITPHTLYGVAVLHHPGRAKLKADVKDRDNMAIFRDDSIEFFISAPGKVQPYYHFAFNAAGAVFDAIGMTKNWNSGFRCAAQPFGNERTAIRFELPLQDIGYSFVEHGVLVPNFGINFCRNHPGKKYSTWGKLGSAFHDPANFNRFQGFSSTGGVIASSSHFANVQKKQELDENAYWKNDKTLFKELFSNEDNPYKDFGSYLWLTPLTQKQNTLYGLQYGKRYNYAEMLETIRKNNVLPFCRYGDIPRYVEWAKKNGTGVIVYFRYYRGDSYPWDLSDDSTMKRKLDELEALLKKYNGIIRGVELGDEIMEVVLGHELSNAVGKPGGASREEVKRIDKLIREKFGFGKYGMPKSLHSNEPFHQLATRRFVLSKIQQMQKGVYEVCQRYRASNGKKVLSISPTQRADNILSQQSRQGEWCDIMTTQVVPMSNHWRQTIAFNTKILADLSGKAVFPCAHIENYHYSHNVETTAAHISEIYRGGGSGMQLYLHEVVGFYNKMGSAYHCYNGHRPRFEKIMEESRRFSQSKKLRFPKPDYAFYLSNDSALAYMLFTEKQCEWLFSLMGPGAGSSFRFISDTQLIDGKIKLKDYPFILLPAAPIQSKAVQKKFDEYVKNGGILICFDPKVFEHADDGTSTAAFREKLFGVKTVPVSGGTKLTLKGYKKPFPLIGQKYALKPAAGVEVIGKSGKDALVTVKKYPKGGKAVMVSIGTEYYYAGQKVWQELAKSELKKLGATTDQDIWKFSLPYKKETRPVVKGTCLTGNYAYWYRDKFTPEANRIPPGATYRVTLAPDGVKDIKPFQFGKGNLMNRLDAVKYGDMFNWMNDAAVKAGKIRLTQFADTWSNTAPFEIRFDLGEKPPVSRLVLYWKGDLPDMKLKFDDGIVLDFKGGKAAEVEEKILRFAPKATSKLTLSLGKRSEKLTLSEVEIWKD